MNSPLVSLNSWVQPGVIYQAAEPVEIIEGGAGDWAKLEEAIGRYAVTGADSSHPRGFAAGYFTYEGGFWFGIFPDVEVHSPDRSNARWLERRNASYADGPPAEWIPEQSREEYEGKVRRAQEYIRAGDIYQVNLAQRFHQPFTGNPHALFEQLLWRSPAPGGAFVDTGSCQVLSSSPELFLKIQGREIQTRPIKGTRPRDRDALRDGQLAYELQTDPKELAELIMITDLERNDLGRICEFGSVTVTDLVKLERYAQVFHLVSTVEGRLRDGVSTVEAIANCFPGGSISGAPKKRACAIIRELEPGPRGIYTGAIGYIGFNGDAAFSVAIRTLVMKDGEISFHVGSGITADSIPSREFDETQHKASGMRQAMDAYREAVSHGAVAR